MTMKGRISRRFFAAAVLMFILLLSGAHSIFAAEIKDSSGNSETSKITAPQETQLTEKQLARLKRANTWEKKDGYYY